MIKKILLICLGVVCSITMNAQSFHFIPDVKWQITKSDYIAGLSGGYNDLLTMVEDDHYQGLKFNPSPSDLQFKSIQDFIYVGVYHDTDLIIPAYKYAVTMQVKKYAPIASSPGYSVTTETVIMNFSYDPDSLQPYNDLNVYKFSGYHAFEVLITDIQDISGTPTTVSRLQLAKNFYIARGVSVQRYNDEDIYIYPRSSVSNNNLHIAWGTSTSAVGGTCPTVITNDIQPVAFDLEWLYIDDYQYNFTTGAVTHAFDAASTIAYDFKNNATRVRVQNNSYDIPLIYERGAIVYRIRGVRPSPANDYETADFLSWNLAESGTVNKTEDCKVYVIGNAHEGDSLNWQYTINFAEEGKYKHVINYFDGALRNRQTQTKINTDNDYIIAVDKAYDYEGNTALQTLPTPVLQSNLKYRSDIAINNSTSAPYAPGDLDAASCALPLSFPQLSSGSQANIYYSPLNTDKTGVQKFVPDAQGYPVIQSIYSPDKLLLWQGGAGARHQPWTEHGTRYEYARATGEELTTFFGTQVGNASYYPKVVTTDPNGQSSFAITNSSGQTVATGLIGMPNFDSVGLEPLPNFDTGTDFCVDMLGASPQNNLGNGLGISTSFYVEKTAKHNLTYKVKVPQYEEPCSGKYLWAKATYAFSATDECGEDKIPLVTGVLGADSISTGMSNVYYGSTPTDYFLKKGKHIVNKELTFNTYEIKDRVSMLVKDNEGPSGCFKDSVYYIRKAVENTTFPCYDTGSTGPCDNRKRQMMKELWPNEKYGKYVKVSNGSYRYDTTTNIFTGEQYIIPLYILSDAFQNVNSIFTVTWRASTPAYDTARRMRYQEACLDLPDTVVKDGRIYTGIDTLPVDTFIYIFNDAIAEALLPLHPEYCKLKLCDDGIFVSSFEQYRTYSQAIQGNRFILDSIINHDPLYYKSDVPIQASVRQMLSRFTNMSPRMDTFALSQAYCAAGNVQSASHCAKYLYASEIGSFSFIDDDLEQKYFENLQQYYLINRQYVLQRMMDSASGGCETCSSYRMDLDGSPVFPTVFTVDGGLDTSMHAAGWMDTLFRNIHDPNFDLSTLTTPTHIGDSINNAKAAMDTARVDVVMDNLQNCSLSATVLDDIRDALISSIITNGNDITDPATVNAAILAAGVSLTDLCNGYIPDLKSFDTLYDNEPDYNCKNPDYYDGLKDFVSRTQVLNVVIAATLSGSTTSSFNLDPNNLYEQEIAATTLIGTSDAVTVQGFIDTLQYSGSPDVRVVKLKITGNSSGRSIYLYFHSKEDGDPVLDGASALSINFVQCSNNDRLGTTTKGLLGKYLSMMEFNIDDGTNPPEDVMYYVWGKHTELMGKLDDQLAVSTITCIDIKNTLKDFDLTLSIGHINRINHPLATKMLTNFLNYKLDANYTYNDYYGLMQGCAVSDSLTLNRYFSTIKVSCSTKTIADSFAARLGRFSPFDMIAYRFQEASGLTTIGVDLAVVPDDSLLFYKSEILSIASGATATATYLPEEELKVFVDGACTVSPAITSYGSFSTSTVTAYMTSSYTVLGTLYTFNGSYTDAKDHADLLDDVNNAITQAACGNSFVINDAELLRSDDYGSTYSNDYLAYVYGLEGHSRYEIRDSIVESNIGLRIGSFSGYDLDYTDPYCSKPIRDLYIYDNTQSSHPGSILLNTILNGVQSELGTDVLFLSDGNYLEEHTQTSIYRKASNVHWYRYFNSSTNRMYNVHLEPPIYAPFDISTLRMDSLHVGPGDDSIYRFTVYMHYTSVPTEAVVCRGYTDFPIGYGVRLNGVVLYDHPGTDYCLDSMDCEYGLLQDAIYAGKIRYNQVFDSTVSAISADMLAYLIANTHDTLLLCGQYQKGQVTLYYYDINGNLRKTVPPEGVNINSANHSKISSYEYDSRNLLVKQTTPDGGTTEFFYDGAGRLVFSQNEKQKDKGKLSYTLYDKLSRIIETGEVVLTDSGAAPPTYVTNAYNDAMYPMDSIIKYVRTLTRFDVVVTTYDTAKTDLSVITVGHLSEQENLINRVAAIAYYPSRAANYPDMNNAVATFTTHYSYDLIGNVKTVTYDCLPMNASNQRYKRVDYDYDQISGKVNMISYNRGKPDQFYQQYSYDADNRITKVETSNDGIIWNRDAAYQYYKHGPLANVKIGNQQIQSIDYAYTIQGWLKAINGDVLRTNKAMMPDGAAGDVSYARDVIAHAMYYFDGDYFPIDNTATVTNFAAPSKGLFNGNIARTQTAIRGLDNQVGTYTYDQLNRLTASAYHTVDEANLTANSPSDLYKNTYTYDRDGNIQTLVRYDGNATQIDSMVYSYKSGNNQLDYVDDKNTVTGGDDFQHGQNAGNYTYDKIGNLVSDANLNMTMNWNLYGKLSKVDQSALGRKINYSYDGLGNRVRKEIVSNVPGTGEVHEGEYYVRDASGNILATYRFKNIYDKISVIGIANNGSYSNPGFPPFVNGIGTPIGTFTSAFAAYVNENMPSWTETQIDRPASFFLTYDAGMYSEILAGGDPPDYMNDLQQYSSDNSTYQIFAVPLNDNPTEAGQIMWLVVQNEIEAKKMFELFDEYMPGADLDNMWTNLGVGSTRSTTDHVANAGTLYSYMTGGGHESEVLDEMATVIADNNANNSGEDAKNFFGAMMHDDVIYESTNLRSAGPPTDFETQIRGLLYMYGNMENITGFFDQWDYTNGWITTHSTPEHRMEVSYVNDANAVMEDFLSNVADVKVLDTLIANTDEISAYDYLLRRSDPDVISSLGPVDQASLYTYGTAIDTTDLAEHHIYGSSRLGVQNYWAGQYRQTYNVNGGVTPITALSTPAVWYSYAYSDLITAGQCSPYGNHHTDSMRVGRTLGYRNYEMTDHLGNVLASVLDRKTGVDTGTGSTHYAYYNPDISSVQDYYPGGMRMDLRNSQVADSVYKFGYNGQRRDDDIAGAFKHNTALFWEYDPLLNRRWNIDPVDQISISNYAAFRNNPILFIDVLGNTVKLGQEEADVTLTGINGVLDGNVNPISYNSDNGQLEYDNNVDISGYTDLQKTMLLRYQALITSDIVTTVHVVNRNEKIPYNGGEATLAQLNNGNGANGVTDPYFIAAEGGGVTLQSQDIYIARDPIRKTVNTTGGFSNNRYKEKVNVTVELEKNPVASKGITSLHEEVGHGYFNLVSPTIDKEKIDEQNIYIENFMDKVFKVYKYNGSKVYRGRTADQHERQSEKYRDQQ